MNSSSKKGRSSRKSRHRDKRSRSPSEEGEMRRPNGMKKVVSKLEDVCKVLKRNDFLTATY